MNKSGQFYLLAAAIIIGLLLGLTTVSNLVVEKPGDKLSSFLTDEIKYELNAVIDNGVLRESPDDDIFGRIKTLGGYYYPNYKNTDFLFVYSTETEVKAVYYNNLDFPLPTIYLGEREIRLSETNGVYEGGLSRQAGENTLTISLDSFSYGYSINLGREIIIMTRKEAGGEIFISSSPSPVSEEFMDSLCPLGHQENQDGTCTATLDSVIEDGHITFLGGTSYTRYSSQSPIDITLSQSSSGQDTVGDSKGYLEWDIFSIPQSRGVSSITFSYYGMQASQNAEKITSLSNTRPSLTSDSVLFNAIKNGDLYAGGDFVAFGENSLQLSQQAVNDLNEKISSGEGWFALGITATPSDVISLSAFSELAVPSPSPNLARISSSEDTAHKPKLIITYTPNV